MPVIKITDLSGNKSELDVASGETLMEALRDNSYDDIEAICGGVCSCSTCHVYIAEEWLSKLSEQTEDEKQLLSSTSHQKPNSRLSCQITVTDEMEGMELATAEQDY